MNPVRHRRTERQQDYIDRLLAGMSPDNRDFAARFLRAKQAEGNRTSTRQNYAVTLARLDVHLNAAPIPEAGPEQLVDFVNKVHTDYSAMTGWGHTTRLRAIVRWVYEMRDQDVPRPIRRALRRRSIFEDLEKEPVSQAEFQALLEAAKKGRPGDDVLRVQSILWTLLDAGFRLSELLSLRLKSVKLEPGGYGKLTLPPLKEVPEGLKTGPRAVDVRMCVPALHAWLAIHPDPGNPEAPFFPAARNPKLEPWASSVEDMLRRLCKLARVRSINPHLLRHTAATRDAENGMIEVDLCAKYGWSRNSEMPRRYVHGARRRLAERARREAGVDGQGAPTGDSMRLCEFCAEPVKAAARKCRHCGEFLAPPSVPVGPGGGGAAERGNGSARI